MLGIWKLKGEVIEKLVNSGERVKQEQEQSKVGSFR